MALRMRTERTAVMFGEELDDRSAMVVKVTLGYTPTPLNHAGNCPKCMGDTYIIALMKRGIGLYVYRSCTACGYAKLEYDSTQRR